MRIKFQLSWVPFIIIAAMVLALSVYMVTTLARNVAPGAAIFGFIFLSIFSFLGLGWARLQSAFATGVELKSGQPMLFMVFRHLIGPIVPAILWSIFTLVGFVVLFLLLIDPAVG